MVAPFARRGRHVDLAASDRQERRLVFRPPAGGKATSPSSDQPHETLQLDCLDGGLYRLTRTLKQAEARQATLQAQGRDLGQLLNDVESVPAERHFATGPGFAISRSYTLNRAAGGAVATLTLTHGSAHVDGLTLTLTVLSGRRAGCHITLEPTSTHKLALPEDLLAVLGWNWARLVPTKEGWRSRLRLRGDPAQRTRIGEAALNITAAHLAQTLAEPPARYHERLRSARWSVFFRRGIPAWTGLSLLGAVGLLARFRPEIPQNMLVALYHVPTVIVAASFVLQELARLEIPPLPRRLQTPTWREQPHPLAGVPATADAATP
jgi:hypothetical protein